MVKLTRTVKNSEFRDDVGTINLRRVRAGSPKNKQHGVVAAAVGQIEAKIPTTATSTATAADSDALMNILQPKVVSCVDPPEATLATLITNLDFTAATEEQRDPAEGMSTQAAVAASIRSADPHHYALTRAAQMALKKHANTAATVAEAAATVTAIAAAAEEDHPADEQEEAEPTTMALIDSIVKTSDDPALIDALQAMMGENEHGLGGSAGAGQQQRETLALIAESLMKKKAARQAMERASQAESRLQASLKKCAPDLLAGDIYAAVPTKQQRVVDAARSADDEIGGEVTTTTPVISNGNPNNKSSNNNNNNNNGFFNRINKSLTSTSHQNATHNRRNMFKQRRSQQKKSKAERKKAEKAAKKMAQEAMKIAAQAGADEPEEYVPAVSGSDAVAPTVVQEQPQSKNNTINMTPKLDAPEDAPKLDAPEEGVEQELVPKELVRLAVQRQMSQNEQQEDEARDDEQGDARDASDSSVDIAGMTGRRQNKYKHIASTEAEVSLVESHSGSDSDDDDASTLQDEVDTLLEALGSGSISGSSLSSSSGSSDSDDDSDDSDSDSDDSDNEDDELALELQKIAYPEIFELESKLSGSTCSSSSMSSSSSSTLMSESQASGSSDDDDDEDDRESDMDDQDTLGDTIVDGEDTVVDGEDMILDRNDILNDDVFLTDDGREDEDEDGVDLDDSEDDDGADEDDDDDVLFAALCQRPDSSYEDEVEASDQKDRKSNSRRRRAEEQSEVQPDVQYLLKCVSGYFVGDASDEEKDHRRKRRSSRRRRS